MNPAQEPTAADGERLEAAPTQQQRNESFLREMTAWVGGRELMPPQEFAVRVAELARVHGSRCERFATDGPSRDIVAQTALVVATYDVLTDAGLPPGQTIEAMVTALGRWVRENAQAYSLARLGISPDAPHEAFQRARENFKARGEQRFGSHFAYVQDVSDEDRSFVSIHRCLYNELGRFLERPQVTPVFCAMDIIWAEHATRPPFNVEFERPTTLASGGDKCRFHFTRRAGSTP